MLRFFANQKDVFQTLNPLLKTLTKGKDSLIIATFLFGALTVFQAHHQQAHAEEALIPLTLSEEIDSAVGYIISANNLAPEIPAQIKSLPDGRKAISFEIGDIDTTSVYVSARIKTKSGSVFFTEITDIKPSENIVQSLASCIRSSKIPFVQSQLENLKSLTENRYKQRGLIRDKIVRELDNGEDKRIWKIEKALGLTEQHPISAEAHPIDLIKREFRLLAALKRWEDSKVSKETVFPTPGAVE